MGLKDFMNTGHYKAEAVRLAAELEQLKLTFTPEMKNVAQLLSLTRSLQQEKELLNSAVDKLNAEIMLKKEKVIQFDESILLQEFGLYEPTFDFQNSAKFLAELEKIRNAQKSMIKLGQATTGNMGWTVNGDNKKGKKMVTDMQKLLLRAFNSECDELISKVKYNNFDQSLKRITSSCDAISKLGSIMQISITTPFHNAKINELRLAFEYREKKQQEKEEQKVIKAQLREEAKLQKELEESRKIAEKERTHYNNALEKAHQQLQTSTNDEETSSLLAKIQQLEAQLNIINNNITDIDYREANQKAGYVYIISNIGAFGENVYKIGMTRRLEPMDRIDELGSASVPFNFDLHAMIFSDNAPKLEGALHNAFADKKVNMINYRREFFNVSLDEIESVIRKNHDKSVEFVKSAEAQQYRESLKLKGHCPSPFSTTPSIVPHPITTETMHTPTLTIPPVAPTNNTSTTPVTTLIRGQKAKISSLDISNKLNIQVLTDKSQSDILDISCFGVNNNNVMPSDEYFIFYNQLTSADNSLKMTIDKSTSTTAVEVNFGLLPTSIHKIVIAIAIDSNMAMGEIQPGVVSFCDKNNLKQAEFCFDGQQFKNEKAVILCEIYRKESDWTISIVSQGFNGGLESLLNHFGGEAQ